MSVFSYDNFKRFRNAASPVKASHLIVSYPSLISYAYALKGVDIQLNLRRKIEYQSKHFAHLISVKLFHSSDGSPRSASALKWKDAPNYTGNSTAATHKRNLHNVSLVDVTQTIKLVFHRHLFLLRKESRLIYGAIYSRDSLQGW